MSESAAPPPEDPPEPGSRRDLPPYTPAQERALKLGARVMSALNRWVFQASGGRVGNRFMHGAPVCLLTTRGARSARLRTTPLIYLAEGDDVVLVASQGGASTSPHWYYNLLAHPDDVEVQVGSQRRKMRARRASAQEKAALWPKLCAIYPDYEDYQARTERDIPVMILSPRA